MFEMTVYEEADADGHRYMFRSKIRGSERTESVHAWCYERFGDPDWRGRWVGGKSEELYWFRDEADAFEFRMRWC